MVKPYVELGIVALLPVAVSILFYILDTKTSFGKMKYIPKQIIIGIAFGALAILGTEFGIPVNGAQVNCRDGAVLTAGLMFGAPAGIIAGVVGGVERWLCVYWGVGAYTRIACSVSTVIAGLYSAMLRKFMFENKKPGATLSLAIGVIMEVFHLTMVFITNMSEPEKAMNVVKACTFPMVIANGLSVMLAALVLNLLHYKKSDHTKKSNIRISQTIQRWLMAAVLFAFITTSYFVFGLQNELAKVQMVSLMQATRSDLADDIKDASDKNILALNQYIAPLANEYNLEELAKENDITDITLIDNDGNIYATTYKPWLGKNMNDLGKQTKDFMVNIKKNDFYVQSYGPADDLTGNRKFSGIKTDNGIVQIGYDAVQFHSDIDEVVSDITKNRTTGREGFVLILDENYKVVSTTEEGQAQKDLISYDYSALKNDIAESSDYYYAVLKAEPDKKKDVASKETPIKFTVTDKDGKATKYSMLAVSSEGYTIVTVMSDNEAYELRNIALYVNTFMEILVFAILFGLIYLLIKKVVVNKIDNINQSLAKITGGDLDEVVNVRSSQEFASLSDDINSTVETLKKYIDEASARIDAELEFAKNIQISSLPNVFPAFPKRKDFDIYASMYTAKEVGGDFYDFYMSESNKLNFLIADVSGKGIPAAMFMMRAKTELKTLTESALPISDVFTKGNIALCEGNDAGMFVTAWQGGIDLKTGKVQFANAGHNPPVIRHADGKFEYLKSRAGFVLAGMDSVQYKAQELQLEAGDIVFLYTDGVTEATDSSDELYGEERLLNVLNSREFEDMRELCDCVKSDVDAFVKDAPQFDDITMVAFRYIGAPAKSIHFDNAVLSDIELATEFIENELIRLNCKRKAIVELKIVIDEIFSNIVKFAYKGETGPVTIRILAKEDYETVYLNFIDEGIPYNPLVKKDPDVTLSAEERDVGGLGIYMVKNLVDDAKYKYEDGHNMFTVQKRIKDEEQ